MTSDLHPRTLAERDDLLELLAGRSRTVPPLDWLTVNAREFVRILVVLAGFDARDLVGRLARVRGRGERLNLATVERVVADIERERRHASRYALVVWYIAVTTPWCAECSELMFADGNGREFERPSDYGNGRGTICTGCAAHYLRPTP